MSRLNELLLLADGLDQLAKVPHVAEIFNMHTWVQSRFVKSPTNDPEFKCGFAGCALGWAQRFIPNFGIEFKPVFEGATSLHPVFNGFQDEGAIAKYFGITVNDASYLFIPDEYREEDDEKEILPAEVAARIRFVVEDYRRK